MLNLRHVSNRPRKQSQWPNCTTNIYCTSSPPSLASVPIPKTLTVLPRPAYILPLTKSVHNNAPTGLAPPHHPLPQPSPGPHTICGSNLPCQMPPCVGRAPYARRLRTLPRNPAYDTLGQYPGYLRARRTASRQNTHNGERQFMSFRDIDAGRTHHSDRHIPAV